MLRYFTSAFLTSGSQIGLNDYSFSNGVTNTFNLTENTFDTLADVAQFGASTFYRKSTSTLTGSGFTAITGTVPSSGLVGIFPNESYGSLAAYDQVSSIQYNESIFFIGDITDIETNTYLAAPSDSGIKVYFSNQIGTGGAQTSWLKFAPLNAADMTIGTYQDAGDPFYLDFDLSAETTTNSFTSAGVTELQVADSSVLQAGQLIRVGSGASAEVLWITTVNPTSVLLLTPTQFSHALDPVYVCGAGFGVRVDIPTNATGGILTNYVNCSLDANFQIVER